MNSKSFILDFILQAITKFPIHQTWLQASKTNTQNNKTVKGQPLTKLIPIFYFELWDNIKI